MKAFSTAFNYQFPDSSYRNACACSRANCFGCETYEKYKEFALPPRTNYDMVRAKTPEEMAEWLEKHDFAVHGMGAKKRMILDWLRSPVEVEDG